MTHEILLNPGSIQTFQGTHYFIIFKGIFFLGILEAWPYRNNRSSVVVRLSKPVVPLLRRTFSSGDFKANCIVNLFSSGGAMAPLAPLLTTAL